MTSLSDIGTLLIATRLAQGITQRELAERVGVKQPQIARWEASEYRSASFSRVDSVAQALSVEIATIPPALAAETPAAYTTTASPISETGNRALARLGVAPETIAAFCRVHGIAELALFGSSVRKDFGPTSDVDVLVTWTDGPTAHGISDLADVETELRGIFRRNVDLVDRETVESSENYLRKTRILEGARVVYVAR